MVVPGECNTEATRGRTFIGKCKSNANILQWGYVDRYWKGIVVVDIG